MKYEERWYWCNVADADDKSTEPDWEKVPEERRELVRIQWRVRNKATFKKWKLWGPQIEMYKNMSGMEVIPLYPVTPDNV